MLYVLILNLMHEQFFQNSLQVTASQLNMVVVSVEYNKSL